MRTLILVLLLGVVSVCMPVGCEPKLAVKPLMRDQSLKTPGEVVFLDGLNSKSQIVRQISDRIEGDLLRIRTQLRNTTGNDLWVDVQVVWKADDGFELYKTNWAPLHLPVGTTAQHEIVSMRSDVADYEYRIRKPVK